MAGQTQAKAQAQVTQAQQDFGVSQEKIQEWREKAEQIRELFDEHQEERGYDEMYDLLEDILREIPGSMTLEELDSLLRRVFGDNHVCTDWTPALNEGYSNDEEVEKVKNTKIDEADGYDVEAPTGWFSQGRVTAWLDHDRWVDFDICL